MNRLRAPGSGQQLSTPSPEPRALFPRAPSPERSSSEPRAPSQEWLPWVCLGSFAALWLARWPAFPLVLDPYYHLMIARQIADAGGPIAYEWWEHAPVGRPHLYPPVLHILLALLLKAGVGPVAALRAASVFLPVALMASLYAASRRLAGAGTALAVLAAACTPFIFHLHCAITLAATLGMIELLWLFVALEEGRPAAAGALAALLGYTHLGLPGMALITVIAQAWMRGPVAWRRAAQAGWGWLLPMPWWLHVLRAQPGLHVTARWENTQVELLPVLLAAALLGLWTSWRKKGPLSWFVACWAGFLALAPRHAFRWLDGEGMLPLILLAGVGITQAAEWFAGRSRGRRLALGGCLAAAAVLLGPTLVRTGEAWQLRWPDSAPWHLLGAPRVAAKELDATFVAPPMEELVALVERETQPNEILWSNAPYAVGLVAALARRPMSSAMFNEVGPSQAFDPIAAAHLVVFFKVGSVPGWVRLADLRRYRLTQVADTELAALYRRTGPAVPARPPQAVMPLAVAAAALGLLAGLAIWDLSQGPSSF